MNEGHLDRLANEVLTAIELGEARSLNWGFLNVRSDLQAILPVILEELPGPALDLWREAQQRGLDPAAIIANLVDRRLLFRSSGDDRFRSRFAEAVRLLFLLRQRFSHEDWQTASRLVSDMRVQLQRRRYPRRDVTVESVLDALRGEQAGEAYLAAVRCLLRDGDNIPLVLANFQQEAILQQYRDLRSRHDRALVIGAGTGAGKTKAFYVPALAQVAATLTPERWVRVLALYPRVELLKDQLAEAVLEARKLDTFLYERGRRPITTGAYYGATPNSAKHLLERPSEEWPLNDRGNGRICPFLQCPNRDCASHDLIWSLEDIRKEAVDNEQGRYGRYARLHCPTCGFETVGEQLQLTRDEMVARPPDVLLTTTEMLNRRLSRAAEHHLFGIDTKTPPFLLLLDEIHTHEGLNGAQVAFLLRRWRHARVRRERRGLCIVGLSATLTQAEQFFAQLTGLPRHRIGYIAPRDEDLIEEGMEYNLVLKGDPVSGTSLLSTSVQTAMLLGRILDPPLRPGDPASSVSRGAYGRKIFAFSDKLDVINRWYHIEQEAETKKVLSQYRQSPRSLNLHERGERNELGQDWAICARIGHILGAPLQLELTSSQYRGVRAAADLVVATSTLEVGFNDPAVGAVIQHKAPRSLASFLQRKGRAGRVRGMRPWMVVVTSAYGRDRWAFQHAEHLFAPELPAINLPLDNYYVRKIQAAFALMDWLTLSLKTEGGGGDLWTLLSSGEWQRSDYLQSQRRRICRLIEQVLNGARLDELSVYLRQALGLDDADDALQSILWGEPRPLLLEVLPTLLRQLETGWQRIVGNKAEPWGDHPQASPMPEFVPANLFSDLNLPELVLHIPDSPTPSSRSAGKVRAADTIRLSADPPDGNDRAMREDERLPLAQALVEFAPGHVNKRYARRHLLKEAHWLGVPDETQLAGGVLELAELGIERDDVPHRVTVEGLEYQVFRPRAYTLDLVPQGVKSTSSARLSWRSHFAPQASHVGLTTVNDDSTDQTGTPLVLTPSSPWRRFFQGIYAHTQAGDAWVDVTRLAVQVDVETRYEGGRESRRSLRFAEGGQQAALGFTIAADALRFELAPLDLLRLRESPRWPELYRHLGPIYFGHKLRHDARLVELGLSTFEIDWLWQLELSMLVAVAIARRCSLPQAAAEVQGDRIRLAERTMRVIFQSLQRDEDDDEDRVGRLHERLRQRLAEIPVQEALREHALVLWDTDDAGLADWLRDCYASSLGASLLAAVTQLVPDIEPDDLLLDIDSGTIWLSEASAGGVGFVSKIAAAIAQRPRSFDLQLLDTVQHCDRAYLATQLRAVAELVQEGISGLAETFAQMRAAAEPSVQDTARRALTALLERHGVPVTRELIVALNSKFLRPNSAPDSDALIAVLVRHWAREEERIGCAIDLRVMAVAAPRIEEVADQVTKVLARVGGGALPVDDNQVFNLLQSLLWLPCQDSCPDCIEGWQPYQTLVRPSRALLMILVNPGNNAIPYASPAWDELLQDALVAEAHARVRCSQAELAACKQDLLTLLVSPIAVGFQLFYPMIERVARDGQEWHIDLVLRELASN